MTVLEKEIEAKLRDMVKKHGGLCLKWVCPGWAGVPDRIVLLPGGRIIFVETKRPKGGRVGSRQMWWKLKLLELGFLHCFIWDEEDLGVFERLELAQSITDFGTEGEKA